MLGWMVSYLQGAHAHLQIVSGLRHGIPIPYTGVRHGTPIPYVPPGARHGTPIPYVPKVR